MYVEGKKHDALIFMQYEMITMIYIFFFSQLSLYVCVHDKST